MLSSEEIESPTSLEPFRLPRADVAQEIEHNQNLQSIVAIVCFQDEARRGFMADIGAKLPFTP
jgi:hypothetical protein